MHRKIVRGAEIHLLARMRGSWLCVMASVFSVRQGGRLASNERGRLEQEPRGQWRADTALRSGEEQSVATSLEQGPQQLHLNDSMVLPSSLWQPGVGAKPVGCN